MERARGAGYGLISRIQQSIVNKNAATFAVQGCSFKHNEGRMNAKGLVSKNKCALRTSVCFFFPFWQIIYPDFTLWLLQLTSKQHSRWTSTHETCCTLLKATYLRKWHSRNTWQDFSFWTEHQKQDWKQKYTAVVNSARLPFSQLTAGSGIYTNEETHTPCV